MGAAFYSMRVEPVTTRIPPDGERCFSQEARLSSFFVAAVRGMGTGDVRPKRYRRSP